jgi:hypothetical protein
MIANAVFADAWANLTTKATRMQAARDTTEPKLDALSPSGPDAPRVSVAEALTTRPKGLPA